MSGVTASRKSNDSSTWIHGQKSRELLGINETSHLLMTESLFHGYIGAPTEKNCQNVPWSKVAILGMVIPPSIGILIIGIQTPTELGWFFPSPIIWKCHGTWFFPDRTRGFWSIHYFGTLGFQAVDFYDHCLCFFHVSRPLVFLVGGFSPTHLKNMRKSNWILSPSRDENKKYWKPPPSFSKDFQLTNPVWTVSFLQSRNDLQGRTLFYIFRRRWIPNYETFICHEAIFACPMPCKSKTVKIPVPWIC